jgi:hypothetical protein
MDIGVNSGPHRKSPDQEVVTSIHSLVNKRFKNKIILIH